MLFRSLAVVALLEDHADLGLVRGQVGTIVEELGAGVYEVDFCDDDGVSYASAALRSSKLLALRHQPGDLAA